MAIKWCEKIQVGTACASTKKKKEKYGGDHRLREIIVLEASKLRDGAASFAWVSHVAKNAEVTLSEASEKAKTAYVVVL